MDMHSFRILHLIWKKNLRQSLSCGRWNFMNVATKRKLVRFNGDNILVVEVICSSNSVFGPTSTDPFDKRFVGLAHYSVLNTFHPNDFKIKSWLIIHALQVCCWWGVCFAMFLTSMSARILTPNGLVILGKQLVDWRCLDSLVTCSPQTPVHVNWV